MTKINQCIIWTNGMVWSLDEKKENCDENTKWSFGKWQEWAEETNFKWYWEKKKNKELIS